MYSFYSVAETACYWHSVPTLVNDNSDDNVHNYNFLNYRIYRNYRQQCIINSLIIEELMLHGQSLHEWTQYLKKPYIYMYFTIDLVAPWISNTAAGERDYKSNFLYKTTPTFDLMIWGIYVLTLAFILIWYSYIIMVNL